MCFLDLESRPYIPICSHYQQNCLQGLLETKQTNPSRPLLQFLFSWPELICLQHIQVTSLREKSPSAYAQRQALNGLRRCCASTTFWWLPGASTLLTIKPEVLWQPPLETEQGVAGAECLSIRSEGKGPELWGLPVVRSFYGWKRWDRCLTSAGKWPQFSYLWKRSNSICLPPGEHDAFGLLMGLGVSGSWSLSA